jgi:hypothetical protein
MLLLERNDTIGADVAVCTIIQRRRQIVGWSLWRQEVCPFCNVKD